jgi:DNA polymerase III delta prime subunit
MLINKYKPEKLQDFIGNKELIKLFIKWLIQWNPEIIKEKCGLLYGNNGIGKSLFIELILKELNYNHIYISNDDDNFEEKYILSISQTSKTFDNKKNILIINDIDGFNDYNFIKLLCEKIIKQSKIPIIFICNDKYCQSIKDIIKYCIDFKMNISTYQEVYRLLYKIIINEKIKIKENQIKQLYELSNGDIRFLLNSLEINYLNSLKLSETNINNYKDYQSTNLFETTSKLFNMELSSEIKFDIYLLNELHNLMIQENYINNTFNTQNDYKKLCNLSYSADALSDSDLIHNFNDGNNWEMESYSMYNNIKSTLKCNKKSAIKFPTYLSKILIIKKNKKNENLFGNEKSIYKSKHFDLNKNISNIKKNNVLSKKEKKIVKKSKTTNK